MSEFEQLYRELILDHYKNPRNHGLLEGADALAEGQNPLCGDEITVSVRLGEGDVIEDVGFGPRLRDQPGRDLHADRPRQGPDRRRGRRDAEGRAARGGSIPLTPVRLKCAILGLGVLKVALHKARDTATGGGTSASEIKLA